MKLTWFPPHGLTPVEFGGPSSPYRWMREEGLSHVPVSPLTTRGPAQPGETLMNVDLRGRSLAIVVLIAGKTRPEYLELRASLSRSLNIQPAEHGHKIQLGTLRFDRDDLQSLQLRCVPVNSPTLLRVGHNISYADIEFYAPQPYWESIGVSSVFLEESGEGFEWPL